MVASVFFLRFSATPLVFESMPVCAVLTVSLLAGALACACCSTVGFIPDLCSWELPVLVLLAGSSGVLRVICESALVFSTMDGVIFDPIFDVEGAGFAAGLPAACVVVVGCVFVCLLMVLVCWAVASCFAAAAIWTGACGAV